MLYCWLLLHRQFYRLSFTNAKQLQIVFHLRIFDGDEILHVLSFNWDWKLFYNYMPKKPKSNREENAEECCMCAISSLIYNLSVVML